MELNEISAKAMGGTEIMYHRLVKELPQELLDRFQIIPSRVRHLDETKYRILWLHDLPGDPESEHLHNKGWEKFHRLVFVSHWQMQRYIEHYKIPWSKCVVLQNAIDPISRCASQKDEYDVRLIYTPTPHRGLEILYAVFEKLAETDKKIHLDVFSSFELYGWPERDKQHQDLFDRLKAHPQITYHGSQPNDVVRKALGSSHIFAYPSIWPETSCLCLIEAMSAGLICVHPDYAALPETAANWTYMYHWNENMMDHAAQFYGMLKGAIDMVRSGHRPQEIQREYTDAFYSWENRIKQWVVFLGTVLNSGESVELPKAKFVYNIG